jgi:hypothetical protein
MTKKWLAIPKKQKKSKFKKTTLAQKKPNQQRQKK